MKKSIKNQIKAEFFEFLRENSCASKFCVNRVKHCKEERILTFINRAPSNEWILTAFAWSDTPQGHKYWENVNFKWEHRLKAIEYNIQKSKDETNSH